jgi:hypothetical protein
MTEINDQPNPDDLFLFGDITDFDMFKSQVQTLIIALSNEVDKRLAEKDKRIEKLEEQFALIFAGYAEQASVIENLLLTIFTDSPEKEQLFRQNLADSRKQFLNLLKEGAEDVLAGEDPQLAATIKNVVDQKLSE